MPAKIPLARYLFTRLKQLHCHSIHGVPGDFFLRALDHIPQGVKWIGCSSELCAGYAADGYARAQFSPLAKHSYASHAPKVGALYTTYGVGELSAINAIAGAYAEYSPVVHFVGTPNTRAWKTASALRPVHHSLGDGRLGIYAEMAKEVTVGMVQFQDHVDRLDEGLERFDDMLRTAVKTKRPVYVGVPSDLVEAEVDTNRLDTNLEVDSLHAGVYHGMVQLVEEAAAKLLHAKRPLLIVDGLAYPFDLSDEANRLAKLLKMPVMSFTSGKGIIDEERCASYHGVLTSQTEYTNGADLVIYFGPILSDTNTGAWTAVPSCENTISFNLDTISVDGREHQISSKLFLSALFEAIDKALNNGSSLTSEYATASSFADPVATNIPAPLSTPTPQPRQTQDLITHSELWLSLENSLRRKDTVVLANGTPLLGMRPIVLPSQTHLLASPIWNSIGSQLPLAAGLSLAKRDMTNAASSDPVHPTTQSKPPQQHRTILFEGDGSFQVTCQSLSDIIRHQIDLIVILINNDGYTYERWLHGMHADFNDMPAWEYTQLGQVFAGRDGSASNYPIYMKKVTRWKQWEEILKDDEVWNGKGLKLIDVHMPKTDVPEAAKAGLSRGSEALKGSVQ